MTSPRSFLDQTHLMAAYQVLQQSPPPSLREILGAYKAKGDGDRDMLLAMLNAKTAEDQRIASVASLHRTLLEVSSLDGKHSPSTQSLTPSFYHSRDSRHPHYPSSITAPRNPPSHLDARTFHSSSCDFPPSPYSSSRSGSEEYSPRSKASMAIGSLLSSGPTRDSISDGDPHASDHLHMSS